METYHVHDFSIPLVELEETYPYQEAADWVVASVGLLGEAYQSRVREAFRSRWIDVYENEGKRSGAYSAPVYGIHPYMLLNYNDTLDAAFTLAHEMGHSMHTVLSHEAQPIHYAAYTIFVAEVPSTLTEVLFLEHLLAQTTDPRRRTVLLQHAIDSITGTFYSQVLFADYELQAHRLVQEGQAITAGGLTELYGGLLDHYYGNALDANELARMTWARIPHFFSSPFYVYQVRDLLRLGGEARDGDPVGRRGGARGRGRPLFRPAEGWRQRLSDGSAPSRGHRSEQPETVEAVSQQLDDLVSRLETELERVSRESRRGGG